VLICSAILLRSICLSNSGWPSLQASLAEDRKLETRQVPGDLWTLILSFVSIRERVK